ncbi:MAG: transcription-repair coupling factor [Bacteroidetes bacterium]|nr:transcription-repair coupling factor [Bacteroidota bacterium]
MSLSSIHQAIATASFSKKLAEWVRRHPPTNGGETGELPPSREHGSASNGEKLVNQAPHLPGEHLSIRGAAGSLPVFLCAQVHEVADRPLLCVLEDGDAAAFFCSDLQQVVGSDENIFLLPPSDSRPFDSEHVSDPAPIIQRADVMQRLATSFRGIIVTSVDALTEKVSPSSRVLEASLDIVVGQLEDPEYLIESLVTQGFTRTEFVEQPGDLALRGGILDVFPFTGAFPVRIEFFGDEIDSIREFDIHTQRSVSRRTSTRIVPNLDAPSESNAHRIPLTDHFVSTGGLLVLVNSAQLFDAARDLFDRRSEARTARIEKGADAEDVSAFYLDESALREALYPFHCLHFGSFQEDVEDRIELDSKPQPSFNTRIAQLRHRLLENHQKAVQTTILCDNVSQEGRLMELLEDDVLAGRASLKVESLHRGFEIPELNLALYTDHEIFDRYHRPSARKQKNRYGGLSLRELQHLTPGDFVVHIDYGVGRFAGLEQITVRERKQEAVRLQYLNGDVLFVNVNALHKLHKFKGKEGHQPVLTKLGSGQWEKAKSRTKSRVKDIARDLIRLYAQRKHSAGYAFGPDSVWQQELEASFQFEDTPDQASTIEAVKADMENAVPMDRLVCGDVGFGKTEIAIRAAFKAVQDGKQVAILVPTTVLATQHYRTFQKRLANFPIEVGVLSRFRTPAQIKETLARLQSGQIDIIIGTHRLISKDVIIKDLGLLVIDEEQRFGVAMKEKLRKLRVSVDTLTLTATPIPRTLQFSLMGARDLSIISTAPPNRQPINTEIHAFDKDLIRDALLYEVNRGGQVFFIHNRVQSIDEIGGMLRMLVPDIRIQVAHGQMSGPTLERVMMEFVEGKFDVLVSTNIIENGLDIANANTIIINRADHFGLAELHQLRGRVGRSDRKAFCYLLVPSIHGLTREAKQRLQAVEEFSDLGSGFHLAMRDLDIRGAGNMLGAEQSGIIAEVGFETYHRILDEAVEELRTEEFADLFDKPHAPRAGETVIEVDADALIPDTYLTNRIERLNLYRKISDRADSAALSEIREELADRFGEPPAEVDNLLTSAEIKLEGQQIRLAKVVFKNERLFLSIPTMEEDPWFYSNVFHPLLAALTEIPNRYVLNDTKGSRLRAIIQEVSSLKEALGVLKGLNEKLQVDTPTGQS